MDSVPNFENFFVITAQSGKNAPADMPWDSGPSIMFLQRANVHGAEIVEKREFCLISPKSGFFKKVGECVRKDHMEIVHIARIIGLMFDKNFFFVNWLDKFKERCYSINRLFWKRRSCL